MEPRSLRTLAPAPTLPFMRKTLTTMVFTAANTRQMSALAIDRQGLSPPPGVLERPTCTLLNRRSPTYLQCRRGGGWQRWGGSGGEGGGEGGGGSGGEGGGRWAIVVAVVVAIAVAVAAAVAAAAVLLVVVRGEWHAYSFLGSTPRYPTDLYHGMCVVFN